MLHITSEAVQGFDDHRGEVEGYVAANGRQPDLQIWGVINVLIGDMILLRNGNASAGFAPQLEARIYGIVEDEAALALLEIIADRKIRANDLKG